MESHDAEFSDHGRTPPLPRRTHTPLQALVEMGFRTPAYTIPEADAIGSSPMNLAVNMLASNLRGGNAATMAELLHLAIKAIGANGYGLTYAIGPMGEVGLLVVPENPETGAPDLDANPGDYAMAYEMGYVEQLQETIQAAMVKRVPQQRGECECNAASPCNSCTTCTPHVNM